MAIEPDLCNYACVAAAVAVEAFNSWLRLDETARSCRLIYACILSSSSSFSTPSICVYMFGYLPPPTLNATESLKSLLVQASSNSLESESLSSTFWRALGNTLRRLISMLAAFELVSSMITLRTMLLFLSTRMPADGSSSNSSSEASTVLSEKRETSLFSSLL